MIRSGLAAFVVALVLFARVASAAEHVVIGSKAFPESWILGEAATLLARESGAVAEHRENLGATEITYAALASGSIDAYPEYTGTIRQVLLADVRMDDLEAMRKELARRGIGMTDPLGFNDGYALAMMPRTAERYGLSSLSDLRRAPDLRVGLTHEFLMRADGYPGLAARYDLGLRDVRGVQHELAVEALARGDLDVVDVYTTDAQIEELGLRLLRDDQAFFPRYDAVFLYRADLPVRAPGAWASMTRLVGRVDEARMRRANAHVVLERHSVHDAARALLHDALGVDVAAQGARSVAREIGRNTLRHLALVAAALLASVLAGVPLGIAAARSRAFSVATTSLAGLVQTIPSLALLALLIPLFGIGAKPAMVALFLYGLLPIVRGTQTGLTTIPAAVTESAEALGLPRRAQLVRVLLPIASPHVFAGIRTSAVIAVGTATLAALIGAEGLGGPILQGIALRDTSRVLEGAIPAALLALAVDAAFALLARAVVPRGLRSGHAEIASLHA